MEADDGAGQRPSGSEPAGSVGGEVPGEELVYPVDRMLANARENFPQVCFGLEAVENGCADDGVERRSTLATSIGTGKKPMLPADADAAKHILDGIVGDLQPAVLDVARQSVPPRACIADGLGQLAAPGNALELLIEPGCELFELGFGQVHSDLLWRTSGGFPAMGRSMSKGRPVFSGASLAIDGLQCPTSCGRVSVVYDGC